MKRFYIQLNGPGSRYVAHYMAAKSEDAISAYYGQNPKAQRTATAVTDDVMDKWIADRIGTSASSVVVVVQERARTPLDDIIDHGRRCAERGAFD